MRRTGIQAVYQPQKTKNKAFAKIAELATTVVQAELGNKSIEAFAQPSSESNCIEIHFTGDLNSDSRTAVRRSMACDIFRRSITPHVKQVGIRQKFHLRCTSRRCREKTFKWVISPVRG